MYVLVPYHGRRGFLYSITLRMPNEMHKSRGSVNRPWNSNLLLPTQFVWDSRIISQSLKNTPSVQMLCAQQNCFSHFRKNIPCLYAGLLRIGQVFSASCKTVYRRVMTIAISCAKCFWFVDLHYVCILQGLQRSWLICRAYYCIQARGMCRRTAQTLLSCSAQSLKWLATVWKATLRFPVRSWFFLRQHLSPHPVWTFLHLDTRWRGVFGFTLWP